MSAETVIAMAALTSAGAGVYAATQKPSTPTLAQAREPVDPEDVTKTKESARRRLRRSQASKSLLTSNWLEEPTLLSPTLGGA